MNYKPEQLEELYQWERNFTTAIQGNWTPRISIPSQKRIKAIYTEATGERIPFNIGCGHCVLNLLKRAGKLYFADKKEIEEAEAKKVAEEAPKPALKPRKTSAKKSDDKPAPKKTKAAKIEK